jgi:3-oxoacyl-[acyl-carrier-protein] synthase-3
MMVRTLQPVEILGSGSYVPEKVVTNRDLEAVMETSDSWIVERTGIRQRHVARDDQAMSDLAIPAARQALAQAGIPGAEIDLVIVGTSTPDMLMPATSALVQHAIGASNAAVFDMEAACTGFVQAFIVAQQFLMTGMYRTALVIGGDLLSKFTNFSDRGTGMLFGDGAGAVILRAGGQDAILSNLMRADGSRSDLITIPIGSRVPPSGERAASGGHHVTMKGREVYKFAVEKVPPTIQEAVQLAGLELSEIDHFVLHQANARIIEAVAKRLDLPMDRMIVNIDMRANTSAGTVPIALAEAVHSGRIKAGDTVCMVGFGSGLTWAASVFRWTAGPVAQED